MLAALPGQHSPTLWHEGQRHSSGVVRDITLALLVTKIKEKPLESGPNSRTSLWQR
jgi:hypothetical protein